ncbi:MULTISPECIES: MgtC/SapB family protein [Actinopolyspora]|uniref:Putative Mg2+ transporter-C (MgtC) family protein n=1 Tax=Actinopolyspora saharensis TaxID=995062 RepID=A0A1H0ZKZ4_9ACTN|nr:MULTISPECIES: MgtC/SapB family protein [Actinopolyspora]NHD15734.1 MgtC/SapB family protein [Actinopolyspora sp. BKK2]NHE75052.1 MgtC/SapB family protein [Actinopolyspora sp. BKK1]SDQ28017.1 putative Mg2+ transporter-C (MgtC) family protein [Actinopolyspora saharensis]
MTSSITGLGELPMLVELGAALLLSSLIGLEREVRAKSAGLRTHALVGVGTALLVLVSKYGFLDTLEWSNVQLGPSRVAAQIVSGIGFIGGGLIFVRRDAVRGLTTAATVWVVAAVGMACGSGLLVLAAATTLAHFIVAVGYQYLVALLRRMLREPQGVRIGYLDGHGVLRNVLTLCTSRGWAVLDLQVEREDSDDNNQRTAVVALRLRGRRDVTALLDELSALPGVLHVASSEPVENGF